MDIGKCPLDVDLSASNLMIQQDVQSFNKVSILEMLWKSSLAERSLGMYPELRFLSNGFGGIYYIVSYSGDKCMEKPRKQEL